MKNLNLDSSNLSGDEEGSSEGTLTCSESPNGSSVKGSPPCTAAAATAATHTAAKMEKKLSATAPEDCSKNGPTIEKNKVVDPEPEKETAVVVDSRPALPRVSMDDFKILKVLGKGAYGKVFQVGFHYKSKNTTKHDLFKKKLCLEIPAGISNNVITYTFTLT